jgi:hypothetical protein
MPTEEEISVAPDTSSVAKQSTDSKTPNPSPATQPAQDEEIVPEPLKLNIIIRIAKTRDLPAISRLLTAAFWDEDAIGRFTHPRRTRFPADVRRFWHRRMRESVTHWAHDLIVAVDAETREIRGLADWKRVGPGAKKARSKGWKWTFRTFSMADKFY